MRTAVVACFLLLPAGLHGSSLSNRVDVAESVQSKRSFSPLKRWPFSAKSNSTNVDDEKVSTKKSGKPKESSEAEQSSSASSESTKGQSRSVISIFSRNRAPKNQTLEVSKDDQGEESKTKKKEKRRASKSQPGGTENKDDQQDKDKFANATQPVEVDSSSKTPTATNETATPPSRNSTLGGKNQLGQQHQLLFLGSPRGGVPGSVPVTTMYGRQTPTPPGGPTSLAAAEVIASIVGTCMRLWFLTWITRRIATQEEAFHATQHFVFERLNDKFIRDAGALQTALNQPPFGISRGRWLREVHRRGTRRDQTKRGLQETFTKTVVVFEITSKNNNLDLEYITSIVNFLLSQHEAHAFGTQKRQDKRSRRKDRDSKMEEESRKPVDLEIVLLVQSPGGAVSTYGLAAAQIQRLSRMEGISTTVCVDMYAASGGYMIASQAHKVIAAPFASLGSIGVMMEGLNFNELLKKYSIQPLVLKSGDSKNPLTTYGPLTRQDVDAEKQRLGKVHEDFRNLVIRGRPQLKDSKDIFDGSVFLGQEAMEKQLVDVVMTSDEYIAEQVQAGHRVLKVYQSTQSRMKLRIPSPLEILPHLKSGVESLVRLLNSSEDDAILPKLVQMGAYFGLIRQICTHAGVLFRPHHSE